MEVGIILKSFEKELSDLDRSEQTVKTYMSNLKIFFKDLNIKTIEDIQNLTKENLKGYIKDISRELEATSVNNKQATLKIFYDFLVKENVVKDNLLKGFRKVTVVPKPITFLEGDDMIRLLKITDEYNKTRKVKKLGERDKLLMCIALNGGLRINEIRNLTTDCFNLEDESITFVGKGRKVRTVYLGTVTMDVYKRWMEDRKKIKIKEGHEKYVFVSVTGGHTSKRWLQEVVYNLCKRAQLEGVSSHKLRHSFATYMVGEGLCTDEEMQEILGHEHIATTMKYRHALTEGLKKSKRMPMFCK